MSSVVETVLRSADLLHVQFELINLTLDVAADGSPRLKRVPGATACIVIRLPAQHVAEEVFNANDARHFPYKALLAGPSRVAVDIPDTVELPPFTVQGILKFIRGRALRLQEQPPGAGPGTAIEVPYRVLLSPAANTRLLHRFTPLPTDDPMTDVKWTGLWSTRLLADGSHGGTTFRALRNAVEIADTSAAPFAMTLDRDKRLEIAKLSERLPAHFVIASPQFMLSALGASAQLKSTWPTSESRVLGLWEHNTVAGRDTFVRTSEPGFLFPFGHRAIKQITYRREFFSSSASSQVAELKKQIVIRIEEAERSYDPPIGYAKDGREMPLKRIRITSQPGDLPADRSPISLSVTATDWNGNIVNLDVSMLFVSVTQTVSSTELADIKRRYLAFNGAAFPPQRMTLAQDAERRGDTTLTVTGMSFDVDVLSVGGQVQPPFLPKLQRATVSIPAVERMLGSVTDAAVGNLPPARTLTLHDSYLNGFPPSDREQIFAKLDPPMSGLSIPPARAGGVTAPKFLPANRLSRSRGLTSQVESLVEAPEVDPAQIIGDAKLLGVIALKDIIARAADDLPAGDPAAMFAMIDQPGVFATRPILKTVQTGPNAAEVVFAWKPRINTSALTGVLTTTPGGAIALSCRGRIKIAPGGPNFEVDGKLVNFGLTFSDLLTLNFNKIAFRSGAGRKMEFDADIRDVSFNKGLAFIEKLNGLLPTESLGSGPQIEPRSDGLMVRFGAGIPSFAVGVMSLQNIALLTSVSLPFVDGKPAAVRFSLSERHQPFLVSVSIFGGTGFFALEVRTDKSVLIEAGIEFGGVVSINLLGIVKGGVYLFAGIYVSMETGGKLVVSGHLRLGGYVDVLGIISISIEIYIALTYYSDERLLLGEGRVTVSVKVLFFSLSKSFAVTRRISGFGDAPSDSLLGFVAAEGARPPDFSATMSRIQWDRYCKAFA